MSIVISGETYYTADEFNALDHAHQQSLAAIKRVTAIADDYQDRNLPAIAARLRVALAIHKGDPFTTSTPGDPVEPHQPIGARAWR